MKKARVISLRLTEEEYNNLAELAKKDNKNISNYIRDRVFKSPKLSIVPNNLVLTAPISATAHTSNVVWYDFGGDIA